MASRTPRTRKPADQLRRRNAPETWTVLPPEGCSLPAPKWPDGKASAAEAARWRELWALPIAAWWHEQRIASNVVARYVRLSLSKPEHATVGQLERELGLTPASMLRMRLAVEYPELEPEQAEDPYGHLRSVSP